MTVPKHWEAAKRVLSEADPVMAGIIGAYQGEMLRGKGDAFHTLARSIVGQQISVKAADSVWARLESRVASRESSGNTFRGQYFTGAVVRSAERLEKKPGAGALKTALLRITEEELRACGLSRSKVIYLKSLAEFFEKENIAEGHWNGMEDEEVIRHITQVKGIGRWSAEMFLIFHLLRPDVFPVADLGLQKAILRHYGLEQGALKEHATRWQPYRSVATWYLWRSLDPLPVEY